MDSLSHPESPSAIVVPSRPGLLRHIAFWLLALVVGTMLSLVLALFFFTQGSPGHNSPGDAAPLVLAAAGMAAVVSLAALPLLLPLLPWALGSGTVGLRWLRVFTLQSASLGLLTTLVGWHFTDDIMRGMAPLVGTVYFAGGLLAAPAVYMEWLLPDGPDRQVTA